MTIKLVAQKMILVKTPNDIFCTYVNKYRRNRILKYNERFQIHTYIDNDTVTYIQYIRTVGIKLKCDERLTKGTKYIRTYVRNVGIELKYDKRRQIQFCAAISIAAHFCHLRCYYYFYNRTVPVQYNTVQTIVNKKKFKID